MRLTVTYPDGEFERNEYPDGDHTSETADAHLATMPRGWLEATLTEDGEVTWRRFPASAWVAVKHWPLSPADHDRCDVDVDMKALESWLQSIGVSVEWGRLLAQPFPGHAIRGDSLEPDHDARVLMRNGRSATFAVLSMLIGEGADYGETMHLVRTGCEHRRESHNRLMYSFRSESFALRNEIRRLKGEPEMTEEEELERCRDSVRERIEAKPVRKSAQWRTAPLADEARDHHRGHADAGGRSWWKVRSPTDDLIASDATGYVSVSVDGFGDYVFAAGNGTPTVAGKIDLALWSEWSPVAEQYGGHVKWPESRHDNTRVTE